MNQWIKSPELINDYETYLVRFVAQRVDQTVYFYGASLRLGKQVKQLKEGYYVALKIQLPTNLEECL